MVQTYKTTATVTALDPAKRTAILLGPDRRNYTVELRPGAIKYDEVRVGDQVTAVVTEKTVVVLEKEGTPPAEAAAAMAALAKKTGTPGDLPSEPLQKTARK